tara:strand:+ start:108 stop:689 length:582 start_codon:yes stop_codon:yes gene_type:complete
MLKASFSGKIEAGCDEAGRGALAGPVVAAAVILPSNFNNCDIKDSKKISFKKRFVLENVIKDSAIDYGIGVVECKEIDTINILSASIKAMHLAIDKICKNIDLLLIDGNKFLKYNRVPHHCIVKGDNLYYSIAAASIIAKVHRDNIMLDLHKKYPVYNWKNNKGYPTKEHRDAIKKHGITKYHRESFQLIKCF